MRVTRVYDDLPARKRQVLPPVDCSKGWLTPPSHFLQALSAHTKLILYCYWLQHELLFLIFLLTKLASVGLHFWDQRWDHHNTQG